MNYLERKKLAIMSIVNQVKGFLRTVSGVSPITLESCVDDNSVINYQLYGNSVQDGEPSPDNPIDVVSVGEKTKNLFDESLLLSSSYVTKVDEGYKVASYPAAYPNTSLLVNHIKNVLKPNVTYTLSRKINKTMSNSAGAISFIDSSGVHIDKVTMPWGLYKSTTFSLTQEEIDSITKVYVYGHAEENIIFEYIQLEEGDTATDYEPYGYKIPVTAHGKNLVDVNVLADMNNCTVSTSGDVVTHSFTNLIDGKTYTLYYKYETTIPTNGVIGIYNGSSVIANFANKEGIVTFVANNTRIRCYIPNINGGVRVFQAFPQYLTIMIEEGSIATEYEPYIAPVTTNIYLSEPLRAIGDYKDYIDFESVKIIRNIFVRQFVRHKSYSSIYAKLTKVVRIGNYHSSPKQKKYNLMLSHILECGAGDNTFYSNNEVIFHHGNTNFNYYFSFSWERLGLTYDGTNVYKTDDDTQTALTNDEIVDVAWDYILSLPEDYKKLYMVLDTPTEETIELSNLPTFKGTTIYTIDTTIQPTEMSVTYYSTIKE